MPAPGGARADPASGREVWAGVDVSTHVWTVYSGVTLAPWSGMHEDGLRFRAAGGYGGYDYDYKLPPDANGDIAKLKFKATTYYADVLVGYLKRFGDLTAKAFVGVSTISHDIEPDDEQALAYGDDIGVKGVVELWLNMGERGWGSLDLSWSSAHDTRAARTRIGYRVWPKLSLGLEAGLNMDSQADCRMDGSTSSKCNQLAGDDIEHADLLDYGRGGAFARYEWDSGEISVSAGALGTSFGDEVEVAPYLTVNWLTQF